MSSDATTTQPKPDLVERAAVYLFLSVGATISETADALRREPGEIRALINASIQAKVAAGVLSPPPAVSSDRTDPAALKLLDLGGVAS